MATPTKAPVSKWGPYGPHTKRHHYENLLAQLKLDRQPFESGWREIGGLMMPGRTRFQVTERNKANQDYRPSKMLDSTGRMALRTLQSGMHAGLTSPARPWFNLSTPDPDLAKVGAVKEWLFTVRQRMLAVFEQTNIYKTLPTVYGDMGAFGTAAVGIVEDDEDLFRAYDYPLGSYAVGVDDRGLVSMFIREYQVSVSMLVGQFGGKGGQRLRPGQQIERAQFSQSTLDAWDRGDYSRSVDVVWAVAPNPERNNRSLYAKDLPFSSCHFERGSESMKADKEKFLRESGFETFPVMVPRWDVTGEDAYGGDSPGWLALGDCRQLMGETREKGKAIAKAITPALKGPSSLLNQKVSSIPGDVTYVDVREGNQGLAPIHEVRLEGIEAISRDIAEVQYRIQRACFEDLFLMIARSDQMLGAERPTAREVEERHEEKLLALGPVLERTEDELLERLIDRTFAMMLKRQLLPPAPQELQGVNLKVEYTSILAAAQKLTGVTGYDRFLQTVVGLAEVAGSSVTAKVRWSKVVDDYADMLGLDPSSIVPTEEAEAQVAAQAEAAQAQQTAETAKTGAQAMQAAAQAPIDPQPEAGPTAMSEFARQMTQAGVH